MIVPASLIRDRVLNPVLNARGENLRQQRLIANECADAIDSLTECITELARTATPEQRPHLWTLLRITRALAASNQAEGADQTAIAGVVDQLAVDLRRAETHGTPQFGVQQLARALRPPLDTLVNARSTTGSRYVTAVRQINEILMQVPSAHLVGNVSLRHELGVTKYTRLIDLIRERS